MKMNTELAVRSDVIGESMALEGSRGIYRLVEKTIGVPPDLVYKIGKGEGGYYASFYDLIAREMGMQFADIETIFEDDYRIKIRQKTRYWNRAGKEILDSEEYEIDCRLLYEKARFSWYKITGWRKNEKGQSIPIKLEGKKILLRDKDHPENPPRVVIELPDEAEQELYENFLTLRRNKLSKAITCARRRLIQRAIGIKKFSFDPKNENWAEEQKMSFYAFLPAEAGKKEGIHAIHDLTDEELPEKDEKKTTAPQEQEAGKPEQKPESNEEKPEDLERKKVEPNKADSKGKESCSNPDCGKPVTAKVAAYSKKKYKRVLCFECQEKEK
jgi:hypothetical protein